MGSVSNHIAFKLEPDLMELLTVRSKAEGAESVNLYAKQLLSQALDQESEFDRLREQIETVSTSLAELREELRNVAKGLLVAATCGQKITTAQAEEWAKLHFPDAESSE